ncbi:hypothetical protein GE09DRAFT_751828 [Coniochaeta sp. 2T2.1]|nr:hypothetical protein GE09DRAFT_751828 [Coniochaeta sp. 2T2.1]
MVTPRFSVELQSLNMQIVLQDENAAGEMTTYNLPHETEEEASAGPSQHDGAADDTRDQYSPILSESDDPPPVFQEMDEEYPSDLSAPTPGRDATLEPDANETPDEGGLEQESTAAAGATGSQAQFNSDFDAAWDAVEEKNERNDEDEEAPGEELSLGAGGTDEPAITSPETLYDPTQPLENRTEQGYSPVEPYDPSEPRAGPLYSPSEPLVTAELPNNDVEPEEGIQRTPTTPSAILEGVLHEEEAGTQAYEPQPSTGLDGVDEAGGVAETRPPNPVVFSGSPILSHGRPQIPEPYVPATPSAHTPSSPWANVQGIPGLTFPDTFIQETRVGQDAARQSLDEQPRTVEEEGWPVEIAESPTYVPPPSRTASLVAMVPSQSTGLADPVPSVDNAGPDAIQEDGDSSGIASEVAPNFQRDDPELPNDNPSGTRSRETTAQPDTPVADVAPAVPTAADAADNALHVYQPPPAQVNPKLSAEQGNKRRISQIWGVHDMHSSKKARTVSNKLLEEVGGYLRASPRTQQKYEVPPNTPVPGVFTTTPNGGQTHRQRSTLGLVTLAQPSKASRPARKLPGRSFGGATTNAKKDADTDSLPDYESPKKSKGKEKATYEDSLPDYESPERPPARRNSQWQRPQVPQSEQASYAAPEPHRATPRPAPQAGAPHVQPKSRPLMPQNGRKVAPYSFHEPARPLQYKSPEPASRAQQSQAPPSNAAQPKSKGSRRSQRIASRANGSQAGFHTASELPAVPEAETEASSSTAGASRSNKRPSPTPDAGSGQASKRPRIRVITRTPPQQHHQQDLGQAPAPGLSQQQASQAWQEDQISPQSLVPPPTPIPQPPPPKKTKPPPADKPYVGKDLKWKDINARLPSSVFGHTSWIQRRFWQVKEETELREAWTEEDEKAIAISISEVSASRYLQKLYDCELPDLFSYGLKYTPPSPDPRGFPQDEDFWIRLARLLPHRLFLGQVFLLRYALQMSVWYRNSRPGTDIGLHAWPFLPPWSHTEPGYVAHLRELRAQHPVDSAAYATKTAEITQTAEFRCLTQVENASGMMELCQLMGDLCHDFHSRFPSREVEGHELYLFCLTERDLIFLEHCLDELDAQRRYIQEQRARTWQETHGYARRQTDEPQEIPYVEEHRGPYANLDAPQGREKSVPIEPVTVDSEFAAFFSSLTREDIYVTNEAMASYRVGKRLAIIAERREAIIRHKLGLRGPDEKRMLLDVPPFDPDPDFHLFTDAQQPEDQVALMVVQGKFVTPRLAGWLKQWLARKAGAGVERWMSTPGRTPERAPGIVPGPWVERGLVGRLESVWLFDGEEGRRVAGAVEEEDTEGEDEDEDEGEEGEEGEERTPVVEHFAVYRRRTMQAPVLAMGGGLWARRKGRGQVGQVP